MKSGSCIYLISCSPIFNVKEVPEFETFDKLNSVQLFSALALNHKENIKPVEKDFSVVYCFDEKDKDLLPAEFCNLTRTLFYGTENQRKPLTLLAEKYFGSFANNLIIFLPSIGFSSTDILKAFDLLKMDDEAFVIGKASNNITAFIGFNTFNADVFENISCMGSDFESLLAAVSKHENFVHVMGNYLFLKDMEDFKQLYTELSGKESLAYCSQAMHEKFTHLFIEYKELLK